MLPVRQRAEREPEVPGLIQPDNRQRAKGLQRRGGRRAGPGRAQQVREDGQVVAEVAVAMSAGLMGHAQQGVSQHQGVARIPYSRYTRSWSFSVNSRMSSLSLSRTPMVSAT